ncbi:O-acyltransferase like protein isoform X2 [Agrilus planipennis]|uniref:O-acyltransferase like protein isoform X2 n=1 Tax=Agrilus planipennis TaxID=224129 RepID=A0A7F5QYM8_AGRPL|nr:O-acyltransferase like protein isoform X2 [Agrilus planipennis]
MMVFTLIFCFAIFAPVTRSEVAGTKNVTHKTTEKNSEPNVTSLASQLNFYNPELLTARWGIVSELISRECQHDIEQYIAALRNGEKWALKMDDASGRYSTGWFWGNHFWTGSKGLCETINPSKKSIRVKRQVTNTSRNERSASTTPISPSQAEGYGPGSLDDDPAPFPVSFNVLRIRLKSNLTEQGKLLHFGMCLPFTCKQKDIHFILEETARGFKKATLNVESIRSQHHDFNVWQDTTFIILCIVTSLVIMMVICGTLYDVRIQKEKQKLNSLHPTCIPFNNNNNNVSEVTTKLDIGLTEEKIGRKDSLGNTESDNFASPSQDTGIENVKPKTFTRKGFFVWLAKKIILSFSLRTNIKSICDQRVGSDTIAVIHGLKSISMAWVILGHTCIIAFKFSDNMEYRKIVQKEFLFQTISNGAFSVDTFFFTSGLLVSFLYFRSNAKGKLESPYIKYKGLTKGLIRFVGLIVYRFARLSAPYLFVLGVVEVCMKWFHYNSIFEPAALDHENCPKYWWRNILYINTLFPTEQMCMLWSWYISDDTQFYIVGAVILILASSHFKSASILLVVFMLSSWTTTGYIAYTNKHIPGTDDPLAHFDKIYDKPWTRLGPYLVGMCVGWILFKTDCKIRMTKVMSIQFCQRVFYTLSAE